MRAANSHVEMLYRRRTESVDSGGSLGRVDKTAGGTCTKGRVEGARRMVINEFTNSLQTLLHVFARQTLFIFAVFVVAACAS